MFRTNTCGELRIENKGTRVTLAGWVQRMRELGAMTFIDLRDRYGITQLVIDDKTADDVRKTAATLGREYVIQAQGEVRERASKNPKIETGDIEIAVDKITILNKSEVPPFTIEDVSDGGDDLRMKYRYLDLRRNPLKHALQLRHHMAQETRRYLDSQNFMEIETPYLVNSTPEGARDFLVPSRVNPGEFYALPQSPQTLKQILMVAGYDRYFQIVRCFRDEDLRADRQPEFTQIDCEMSFVEQPDILAMFEGLAKHLFKSILNIDIKEVPHMTWDDAMRDYGSDKPDVRFGMKMHQINALVQGNGFSVFDKAEYIGAICAKGCAHYTRKQIDELTEWVKRPQVGAGGLIYIRLGDEGIKSSIDKFYTPEQLQKVADEMQAEKGDLILILCGAKHKTQVQLGTLRIEMGNRLGLRKAGEFAPLWIVDFPLFEWNEDDQRFYAMHHPFTAPKPEQLDKFFSNEHDDIDSVKANAYDFVMNGVELGGGSIRIHDPKIQERMFEILGFTREKAEQQFGFLMNAFKFGAPPHGGLAFGFDRFCAMMGGSDSIRDYIAFPKNNNARDMMLNSPTPVAPDQLKDLSIKLDVKETK